LVSKTRVRRVIVNNTKCTGCRTCEIVCSLVNDGECNPELARLKVYYDPFTAETRIEVGPKCMVCQECIKWCPTGALKAGYSREGAQ
jgi:Fe-S-cluster-containing dehydrogenase component